MTPHPDPAEQALPPAAPARCGLAGLNEAVNDAVSDVLNNAADGSADSAAGACTVPDPYADPRRVTFLFTDIEGSTRLWDTQPAAMQVALRQHDALSDEVVGRHGGRLVKTTGDGMHAVFPDPLAGVLAARDFALALADPARALALPLQARAGLHLGYDERRGGDFYGRDVNRAARIMQCGHGGQILLSRAVAAAVRDALPAQGASLVDLGLARLRDLGAPEQIHQLQAPGLRAHFPALRSLAATPNNLPQQADRFIGRERELAELTRRLVAPAQPPRLLTLVGLGGLGKTRLALQLGAELLEHYPDGVWFVELAALVDPALVPQAVASVLGVQEEAGRCLHEVLDTHVRERRLLIVLDNCEHLLGACAELASRLLRASPGLQLLATSREALRIRGESCLALEPLAVPGRQRVPSVAEVAAGPAVQLFVDRVRQVQADFRLDASTALPVAEIVRQLDGIPLALELAAARVRLMSVASLAGRLSDRFRLLRQGDRSAQPRQQTLQALIDWSHELLDGRERRLFRRLAVFAGSWTLEAAEQVCADKPAAGDEAIDALDIADLLGALVEKSLISLDREQERYRMLETVRQYAQLKLVAAGEDPALRRRHLAVYLARAEGLRAELVGPGQGLAMASFDQERENLLACHAACDQAEEGAELGVRLASALRRYCIDRGLLGLGLRLASDALLRLPASRRDAVRSNALFDIGQLCYFTGHYARARGHLDELIVLARELGDRELEFDAATVLGTCLLGLDEAAAGQACLERAYALAHQLGQPDRVAMAANCLAQVHRARGHHGPATALNEETLAYARQQADGQMMGIALLNLAMLQVEQGRPRTAIHHLRETAELAAVQQSPILRQSLCEAAVGLAATLGDWERGGRLLVQAQALAQHNGLQRDPADEAYFAPRAEQIRRQLGEARLRAFMQTLEAEAADLAEGDALLFELQLWLDGLTPALRPAPAAANPLRAGVLAPAVESWPSRPSWRGMGRATRQHPA